MGERILVIKLGSFGDVLFAMGALQDIVDNHPHAEISVLTRSPYRRIFERCPWVHRVLVDRFLPKWRVDYLLKLESEVGFGRYDRVYDLQKSSRSRFYFRIFGRGVAWSGDSKGSSLGYRKPPGVNLSGVENFTLQLQAAGVPVKHVASPDMQWMAEDVGPLMHDAGVVPPYVLLMPGASARHQYKCWPYYPQLAQRLVDAGVCVVSAPGPDDLDLCKALPGIMLLNPDGRWLDFFQLAGVQQDAAFTVGNDSGPTHLAGHMRAPGLALFGRATSSYAVNMKRNAVTCLIRDDLADITVDEVLQNVMTQLGR